MRFIKNTFIILFFIIAKITASFAWTLESISIVTNDENLSNSISSSAINDCIELLQKACGCEVRLNNPDAQIVLQLPEILPETDQTSRFQENVSYPYLAYPNHDYSWYSQRIGDQILLQLQTTSPQGISCGLYGLLQEQLWFSFYHPKETHLPKLRYWPLTESFYWHAKARFDKKGFHLHTMHPLELTEALMDKNFPKGMEEIKRYIDWLARNQQNYFEFNVLEGINELEWGAYMKEMVKYAKSRGVLVGIDISLNMSQQKAYKLYSGFLASSPQRKKQINQRLASLCQAKWDVVNMEFSTTEFTQGNLQKRLELQRYVNELLKNNYNAKLMGRKHVVQEDKMRLSKKAQKAQTLTPAQQQLDAHRGVLVHTVMFYSLFDIKAPVYENKNFAHSLELLKAEQQKRETWYYPESAYWITFDNSVPMLLLPYLSARLQDIQGADSLGVKGHVTFSSGWEWGYWLVDWSIARWSWKHEINGLPQENTPCQYVGDLFKRERIVTLFADALALQETYLKNRELIRYMAAASVTDELPKPFNMEFQPRPEYSMKWWRYKSTYDDVEAFKRKVIRPLAEFAQKNDEIIQKLLTEERMIGDSHLRNLFAELVRGLKITGLRAKHRAHTLTYLVSKREAVWSKSDKKGNVSELEKARKVREEAMQLVQLQEYTYRYSIDLIARERAGYTVYDFGYLYPVSNLHFWKREEEQILHDKYHPFFMNIWNLARTVGLMN